MGYDLHVHTLASDGTLSPREVIQKAIDQGLKGLAITDHDTVAGLQSAWEFVAQQHYVIDFIPGIEMNTEAGLHEVHILGYFIDWKNINLLHRLEEIKKARQQRAITMVDRLNQLGFNIHLQRVRELAGSDLLARPHIAMAMMEKGYVFSVKEAFEKHIGKGKPAYVPRYKFLPNEAVSLIKGAGGLAVLAHPGLVGDDRLVRQLLNRGMDGIEVYYPEHSEDDVARYLEMAEERGLLVTGGSDFHGSNSGRNCLGCVKVPEGLVKSMKTANRQPKSG